jgi:hypothetical protein
MWNQIEKFIADKLSFMSPGSGVAGQFLQQPDWVQSIVRDALSSALPGGLLPPGTRSRKGGTATQPSGVSTEVFETHRQVIAKIKLPSKENARALQVLVRSDTIKLIGLAGGEPLLIRLPAPVVARSARARFRERVLEVYVQKRKKGRYIETFVEY